MPWTKELSRPGQRLGPRTKRVSTGVELRPCRRFSKQDGQQEKSKPLLSVSLQSTPIHDWFRRSVKCATGLDIFVMLPLNILSPKLIEAHGYNCKQISFFEEVTASKSLAPQKLQHPSSGKKKLKKTHRKGTYKALLYELPCQP